MLASNMVAFVDDKRMVGGSEERLREAGHALSMQECYLGLQDALRKLRPATKLPGAWAGVVVHNNPDLGIVVLTSQEKWDKTKAVCCHWLHLLVAGHTELAFKPLESDVRPGLPSVRRRRLPSHETIFEGLSSNLGSVAWQEG